MVALRGVLVSVRERDLVCFPSRPEMVRLPSFLCELVEFGIQISKEEQVNTRFYTHTINSYS